jgi:hypothetical protein
MHNRIPECHVPISGWWVNGITGRRAEDGRRANEGTDEERAPLLEE